MFNDALNEYFENAIREFAVQHFKERMEQATEREAAENAEYLSREIAWYEKQKDIVRQGDILLISVGPAVWKIPAKDEQFVRDVLPVFAKTLPPLEPPEAAELRRVQKKLSRDRWRLKPADREALEKDIENAKAALERAQNRAPVPRYGIYKTVEGRDVGAHRLYLRCDDDEKVAAFDGDLTNFCNVPLRYEVQRNFGLTEHQRKQLAPIYRETVVPNLYVISSVSNPAHGRMQADFERDRIILTDNPESAQAGVISNDNATAMSPRLRRAGEAFDALFEK